MTYCLPKKMVNAFLAALKDGKIDPDKLMAMTSQERRGYFAKIIGEDNAKEVNTLFESKMLLADQKRGLVTWARQLSGLSDKQKLDFISKVEKLERVLDPKEERAFLADLAEQKIGASVTVEEARSISQGAKQIVELRQDWDQNTGSWSSETARIKYGTAYVEYQNYVGTLLRDAKALSFKEWSKSPKQWLLTTASATKGIVASMDNSFFGRQGIKMLFTNPGTWTNAFVKSWGDIAKELGGHDAMLPIKADIFSRPNAMNGKYNNAKIALGIEFEEAFPSALPEKIPGFGRLYKASEAAFNGAAMRMRADYADKMIGLAEQFGVEMDHKGGQAEGIGSLVNAMTGRGNINLGKGTADAVNAAFFSLRFLKSNFDTLTGHRLGFAIEAGPARHFVRQQAAENLAKIAVGMSAVLFTASQLWPGSVDWDPRSANFGKIRIGDTRFDITGGIGSLVTLASRLVPTTHNGKWSFWSKSSTTGKWTDLHAGKFGQSTALDVIENFWEGKLSPAAGLVRDVWKGETYGGQPVTVEGAIQSLVTPIGVQTAQDTLNDPRSAPLLAVLILDGLGIGANTYPNHKSHVPQKSLVDLISQ